MTRQPIIEDLTLAPLPAWWQNPWLWLAAAALVAGAIWYARRPRKPHIPTLKTQKSEIPGPPPHFEALRRLAALRQNHAKLGAYDIALECSDVLRRYIEGRFALPIRFQTTREFLGAAQSDSALDAFAQAELGDFLKFFDAIKFAREEAAGEQTLNAIDGAERFVRRCMPQTGAGQ